MMEDCAPGMSTPQGCTDDLDVIETFKEALKQRVGDERFQIWFSGVRFEVGSIESGQHSPESSTTGRTIIAVAGAQFAADRLSKHYMTAMRGAAAAACGQATPVKIAVDDRPAQQIELPFDDNGPQSTVESDQGGKPRQKRSDSEVKRSRGGTQSLQSILRDGTNSRKPARLQTKSSLKHVAAATQPTTQTSETTSTLPKRQPNQAQSGESVAVAMDSASGHRELSWETFVGGQSNELARTACKMAIENPSLASPLVLWGPPGSGKSHLLSAVAGKLRAIHRLRRVVYLSAEEFTNDFIKALNGNCLPAFRSRFRDADALLIDDIQFFVEKKATIRELHHTIEMLAEVGKPLVFAGTKSPTEINGLGGELSGRLASGLVCQVESLDNQTRAQLLSRYAQQRCLLPWPETTLSEIADLASGDGRLLSGIVNLVALLQRMYGQMPTMDQIRQHGGHLLRSSGVPVTLGAIERAVEKVFQLESKSLQSGSQTKSITGPRMLAMYLARELTSSAFSEIGGHFGGRSHSTAILANQRVRQWLESGRAIGRGQAALSADEAVRRIETMLKTG